MQLKDSYTVVTTRGRVLNEGDQGVIIVSEDEHPCMVVDEVSDDEVINLFIDCPEQSSGFQHLHGCWQLLLNRKDLSAKNGSTGN